MKEKFEDRTLTGKIKVACKYDDGTVRYWDTTKEEVVQHIIDIVDMYEEEGYVLTLRQLHYQLVKSNWIVNHDSAYKKLGGILDDCKYAGVIDWENIEDRGRVPHLKYWAEDVEAALEDTYNQYRIDRQRGQQNNIELWTEKDALSGILRRSTEKYHINLVVNKGYTSSSAIYRAYQRCIECLKDARKFTILYFGDHDPSGLDMVRDIEQRMKFMLNHGRLNLSQNLINEYFKVLPIGLTMTQIKKYELPPNPTKLTDSRAKSYISRFGKTCWEVDALSPKILTDIVEANIKLEIDMGMFDDVMTEEKQDKKKLREIIDSL